MFEQENYKIKIITNIHTIWYLNEEIVIIHEQDPLLISPLGCLWLYCISLSKSKETLAHYFFNPLSAKVRFFVCLNSNFETRFLTIGLSCYSYKVCHIFQKNKPRIRVMSEYEYLNLRNNFKLYKNY